MLASARHKARAFGHRRILVVCREHNLPSRRVIEKCGGVFERSVLDAHGEGLNGKSTLYPSRSANPRFSGIRLLGWTGPHSAAIESIEKAVELA